MRSTGEVLGLSESYGEAFYKAQEAVQSKLPLSGTVLISVNRKDKAEVVEVAKLFHENNFRIIATEGTCQLINEAGIPAEKVKKLCEGRPNVLDEITNGQVDIIVNSPVGKDSVYDDSYLRKARLREEFRTARQWQRLWQRQQESMQSIILTAARLHHCRSCMAGLNRSKTYEEFINPWSRRLWSYDQGDRTGTGIRRDSISG